MRSGRPRWGQVQTLFKAKIALSFPDGEHSIPWLLDEGDIILALRQLLRQDSLVMLGFSLLSVKRNLSGGRTRFYTTDRWNLFWSTARGRGLIS